MSEKQNIEAGNALHPPPDWMTDEVFVADYAAEHLPDGEAVDRCEDATGCCVGCEHRRFAQQSVEPTAGDWCYLVHGIGGEDRWGECPALISAGRAAR